MNTLSSLSPSGGTVYPVARVLRVSGCWRLVRYPNYIYGLEKTYAGSWRAVTSFASVVDAGRDYLSKLGNL
jgi:hypothetical protein